MKNEEYYRGSDLVPPREENFTSYWLYNEGYVVFSGRRLPTDYKTLFPGAILQKKVDKEAYLSAREDFSSKKAARMREHKEDLFDWFRVKDNPKRERCYELAYELGHSGGLSEVYNVFDQLVDLIK